MGALAEPRVKLTGVSKTFGAVRALVGVSAEFRAGRVSVVLGPNGSGKSTLLSILAGLARPSGGAVDHGSLGRTRAEVRACVGWVGHDSLCYLDMSGRENLELAAHLRGLDPRLVFAESCARFDLASFADRPVRTYSRGQRQRTSLARALLHKPELVLLDEPTSGLDSASMARLSAVIREEATRGAVLIMVTHDDGFARDVGDDYFMLERGRLRTEARHEDKSA